MTLEEDPPTQNQPISLGIPAVTIDGGAKGKERIPRRDLRQHGLLERHPAGALLAIALALVTPNRVLNDAASTTNSHPRRGPRARKCGSSLDARLAVVPVLNEKRGRKRISLRDVKCATNPSAELHKWLQIVGVIVTLEPFHSPAAVAPPASRCRHGGFVRVIRPVYMARALALLLGLGGRSPSGEADPETIDAEADLRQPRIFSD